MPQEKSSNIEQLQQVVNRSKVIIDGLEHNQSWEFVLEDLSKQQKHLDDTWQFVKDEKQWFEYRITKLATMKLLNLVDDYKADMQRAETEIFTINNPDIITQKDVPNEGA